MAVGRITGPLLKANLLRDGVPLAFETDLLYLDVVTGRVGIKTATPTHELTVNGTTRTTNLITTEADIATFNIAGSTISSSNSQITLQPSGANAVVYQGKIITGDLQISANTIETTVTDLDLEIKTVGTGEVNINSNVLVNGNLHATGTITADGDIQLGNNLAEDTITFSAEITSNLIPGLDDITSLPKYTLGSDANRWNNLYVKDVFAESFTTANFSVNGIDLVLPQGNIIYVATAGNDSNSGTHENDPFLTVKYALSQAVSGDTVFIYPGEYSEIFPLTIPVGVTIRGASIRSVVIQPTVGTVDKDAFLINGETTVEDLTITGFRFNVGNNTGYGFRFDTNFTVTTRSPYIRNVTVITRGSVTSVSDPYGFDQNDAGKGALLDGSIANVGSKEAAMLFHSCTFFTPNQETITATNGVRIEWLNSFTYFADKGLYAYSSADGFAGAGLTRLRIDNRTGTWAVGNTVNYYDTNGTTVLGTGTIASIDGNYVNLTGRSLGFETITDRIPTTVYAQGDAKLSTAEKKFGTASLALDGTGAYVTHPLAPDFGFGTGNFTIEAWIKPAVNTGVRPIIDLRLGSANNILIYLNGPDIRVNSQDATVITGSAAITSTTQWYHIALSKSGSNTRLYVDGTQVGSTYTDNNSYAQTSLLIGVNTILASYFNGYIDDVRISKGVARYTTTFTAPTAELTGDLDTVLLLHFNGTNNSTTLLDSGITLQDLRTSAGGTASIINFADYSDFGVEVRAIGSANVYGNYGVHGTGVGVIAYLISQNFAYIGAGKLTTNDPNDRIAVNEVVESDGAKIYYTSVDNEGNFKIGDSFYVNQKTGEVLFNGQTLNIASSSGATFTNGVNTTTITPTNIDTGNIRVSGNTVESITGNLNITSASGAINLQNNTFITGDLDVTGDITLGGNIQIGDANTDTINFVGGINSNLVPATNNFYNLGSSVDNLWWQNIYLNRAEIDGVVIDSNQIATTIGNDDLTLVASGTGRIYIPTSDVQIDQNLNVTGTLYAGTFDVTNTLTANIFTTGDIEINDNYITTTLPASDLILSANGAGRVYVTGTNVEIAQTLTVTGLTTLDDLDINGNVVQYGDVTQTGNVIQTGTYHLTGGLTVDGLIAQFQDIKLDANLLTTTVTNSDLNIVANGTGKVYIPNNDVQIDQNLTVLGILDAGTINVTNTLTSNIFTTGDIEINDNYITTTLLASNLELKANGTGKITVPTNDVAITQQLGVTGLTTLGNVDINGNVVQYGDVTQTGNVIQTGTYNLTGKLTVDGQITQFANIKLDNNLITTTVTNSNLELVANGTGKVYIPNNDVQIDQNLTVTQDLTVTTGTTYLKNTSVTGTITQTGDINQTGNFTTSGNTQVTGNITSTGYLDLPSINITGTTITTKTAGTDLNLVANGAGNVVIEGIKISDNNIQSVVTNSNITLTPQGTGSVVVSSNQSLILPIGDNSQRPLTPTNGMIRYNNQIGRYEGYNGSYWLPMSGVQDVDGNTYITAEATPGANDNTLRFYADNSLMVTIDSTKLFAERLQTTALDIQNNTITTIVTDTDINLTTPGTGGVKVGNLRIRNNTITNTAAGGITEFLQTGSGYVKITGTNGVVIPAGDTEFDRPVVPERGMIRYNTVLQLVEIYNGVTWTSVAGTSSGISEAQATDIGILTALLFG